MCPRIDAPPSKQYEFWNTQASHANIISLSQEPKPLRVRNGIMLKIHFAPIVFAVLLVTGAVTSAQHAPPRLTPAQWQADVDILSQAMPRQHPNLFRRMKREDFETAVRQFRDRMPSLNEDEIIVGLMKIVAMVHDGHTGIFPHSYFRSGIYPVCFYVYQDGLFVRQASPDYPGAVGSRVLKIGNTGADEALRMLGHLVAAVNQMCVK